MGQWESKAMWPNLIFLSHPQFSKTLNVAPADPSRTCLVIVMFNLAEEEKLAVYSFYCS